MDCGQSYKTHDIAALIIDAGMRVFRPYPETGWHAAFVEIHNRCRSVSPHLSDGCFGQSLNQALFNFLQDAEDTFVQRMFDRTG